MKNFLKAIGRKTYFSFKRFARAMKSLNILTFGAIFLAGTLVPTPAIADGLYQVNIYPNQSTIELGASKTFTAQAYLGTQNVTGQSSFTWMVSQNDNTIFSTNTAGSALTYTPTTAGTYTVRAQGVYGTLDPAWQVVPATLVVNPATGNDDDNGGIGGDDQGDATKHLQLAIYPNMSTITLGQSKYYTAQAYFGTDLITSASQVTWLVSKGYQSLHTSTGANLNYTPTAIGTYTVRAKVKYTNLDEVWAVPATLNVLTGNNEPPVTVDTRYYQVDIYPTYSEILLGDSKLYTAQAYLGTQNVTGASQYNWEVRKGSGAWIQVTGGQTLNYTPATSGTYYLRTTGTWGSGSNLKTALSHQTAQLIVKDVIITEPDDIRVEIIPDLRSVYQYEETTYTAIVYNEANQNVTSTTTLDWSILDGNAIILDENHDFLRIKAQGNLGTFNNIRVFATRNGKNDDDLAALNVRANITPPVCDYLLNASIYGVIEDGSSPSANDIILYTVKIQNFRPCTLNNVMVRVAVPNHTTYVSHNSPYGSTWLSGLNAYWNAGSLVQGQEKIMYLRVRIGDNVPVQGWYITAFGDADANEIAKFPIQSNQIFVPGKATPPVNPDLPKTGVDWMIMLLIALSSLGLATLTYAWMYSRRVRYEVRF